MTTPTLRTINRLNTFTVGGMRFLVLGKLGIQPHDPGKRGRVPCLMLENTDEDGRGVGEVYWIPVETLNRGAEAYVWLPDNTRPFYWVMHTLRKLNVNP